MRFCLGGLCFILLSCIAACYHYTAWQRAVLAPQGAAPKDLSQNFGACCTVEVDRRAQGQACPGTVIARSTPQRLKHEPRLEVQDLPDFQSGNSQFLLYLWAKLAGGVGETEARTPAYLHSRAALTPQEEIATAPRTEGSRKASPCWHAAAYAAQGSCQGHGRQRRYRELCAGLKPAAGYAAVSSSGATQASVRECCVGGQTYLGHPDGAAYVIWDSPHARGGCACYTVQERECAAPWEKAASSGRQADAGAKGVISLEQRETNLREDVVRLPEQAGDSGTDAGRAAPEDSGGFRGLGGWMAPTAQRGNHPARAVDWGQGVSGCQRDGGGRRVRGPGDRARGRAKAGPRGHGGQVRELDAVLTDGATAGCAGRDSRGLQDSSQAGQGGKGGRRFQSGAICRSFRKCLQICLACAGASQGCSWQNEAAPQLGPCDSFMSAQGPNLFLQWDHSITTERSFVSIWTAQLQALQCEFEVAAGACNPLFSLLVDERAGGQQEEADRYAWCPPTGLRATGHTGEGPCLPSTFRVPLCSMGGAGVELDAVEHGQPGFGVICDASPRHLASRDRLDVQFPCTGIGRRVLFSETVDLTVYDPRACLSRGASFSAARTAYRGDVVRSSRRFPRPLSEFKDGSLSNLAPFTSALACQPTPAIPILECKDGSLSNLAPALFPPANPAFAMPSSGSRRPGGCDDGPSLLKHLFARQAQLLPAFLDSPLADKLPQEILALAQPEPSSDEAKHYALFDPEDDVRSRPAAPSWTVHEYAVDATRAVRFLPRAIQFLTKPLSGLPAPQLVVTPTRVARDTWAIPLDLRFQGGRIATVLLTVPCRDEDVVAQLQPKGHDVDGRIALGLRRGDLGLYDSQGVRVVQADESPEVYQWFVLRSVRDLPDEMRECTTRTTTGMQTSGPPMLLGQEVGLAPHEIPFNLLHVHLVPDGLREPYGARVPAAQLRLFSQLDPAAKDNKPVTFLMMVKGYPPVTLQGGRQWSLLDFASYAASQLDEPVRRVQLLTTSVPGIQEPQVIVTEGDANIDLAAVETVLPVDLRGFGAGVMPTALSPGMTCDDVLRAVQLLDTSLQTTMSSVSTSDLFLQDAQGQVYEELPAHLLHMQWLVVRKRGDFSPWHLALPTSTTTTTTTTTTHMQPVYADHRTVQFIMVGAGTTVRLPEVPYNQADPQVALLELLRALVRLGRLGTAFQVQLAPVLPRTSSSSRFVVPLLHTPEQQATTQGQMITVLYDPGVDGSQIHTMVLEAGTRASEILSEAQRRSGAQLYVNGVRSNVCSRPLLNGDLIQQLGGRFQGTARNAGPLLDDISRLRCLTFPMHLPALGLFLAPHGEIVAPLVGSHSLEGVVGDAFEDRLDQLGRPARTSKRLTVFQPGHAPHVLWVPTPLTPSVAEAVALLSDTGLFQAGTTLVEAASYVEVWAADAFIAVPSEATWITCTIGDPFAVLYYTCFCMYLPGPHRRWITCPCAMG